MWSGGRNSGPPDEGRPCQRFASMRPEWHLVSRSPANRAAVACRRSLRRHKEAWRGLRRLLAEFGIVISQGIAHIAKRLPELIEDASNELPRVLSWPACSATEPCLAKVWKSNSRWRASGTVFCSSDSISCTVRSSAWRYRSSASSLAHWALIAAHSMRVSRVISIAERRQRARAQATKPSTPVQQSRSTPRPHATCRRSWQGIPVDSDATAARLCRASAQPARRVRVHLASRARRELRPGAGDAVPARAVDE